MTVSMVENRLVVSVNVPVTLQPGAGNSHGDGFGIGSRTVWLLKFPTGTNAKNPDSYLSGFF
jgi:hypothetical protein